MAKKRAKRPILHIPPSTEAERIRDDARQRRRANKSRKSVGLPPIGRKKK